MFLKFVKVGHYRTGRSQTSVPEERYREASQQTLSIYEFGTETEMKYCDDDDDNDDDDDDDNDDEFNVFSQSIVNK